MLALTIFVIDTTRCTGLDVTVCMDKEHILIARLSNNAQCDGSAFPPISQQLIFVENVVMVTIMQFLCALLCSSYCQKFLVN